MARSLQDQVIDGAIKIIEDPSRWTCDATARTVFGIECLPTRWFVQKLCGEGAIELSAYRLVGDKVEAQKLAYNIIRQHSLCSINDRQGREAVIAEMRKILTEV